MSKNYKQFISVTDFVSRDQSDDMSGLFIDLISGGGPIIDVGVGVMMSRKTLTGEPTKWSKAFPKNEDIAKIFIDHSYVFNVLHYADSDEGMTTIDHLVQATGYGGEYMHALQLDMCWPDLWMIKKYKSMFPKIKVILQIGNKSFAIANSEAELLGRLSAYGDAIDYVLIDRSEGRGIPLDPKKTIPTIRLLKDNYPDLGIIVAGGLGPNTLDLLVPIVKEFPDVSTDAQGRLRPSGDALNEPIDWPMAKEYATKTYDIFKIYEPV